MNFAINYPESPLFVIAKSTDDGLTKLAAMERSGQLGVEYLVNPKTVQFSVLSWFGYQTATRTPVEEVLESLDQAFEFVSSPKNLHQLREFLEVLTKKLPAANVPAISAQVADTFKISENTAVLVLAIRYAILRPGSKHAE